MAKFTLRSTAGLAAAGIVLYGLGKQSAQTHDEEIGGSQLSEAQMREIVARQLEKKRKRKRIAIDGAFVAKLRSLLRIVLPSWRSRSARLLALHTLFLVARTFASILVARLDGALVKAIVDRDGTAFASQMVRWNSPVLKPILTWALKEYSTC